MTDVLLHIGLHKTGSTFLQRNVFPYIEDSITYYWCNPIADCDKDKLVIVSDECFTSSMSPPRRVLHNRIKYANALKNGYPDGKVLLVLRDKKKIPHSLYSQYVKGGGIYSYGYWLENMFDNDALDYDKLINIYKSRFKEILIMHFEMLKSDEYGFIKIICDFIGRPVPSYKHQVSNKKLGHYSLKAVRIINNLFATPKNTRAFLFPHCMHPRFVHQAMHWKKEKRKIDKLRRVMWYESSRKNNKR